MYYTLIKQKVRFHPKKSLNFSITLLLLDSAVTMIVHLKISRALESFSLLIWILCLVIILGHSIAVMNSNFSCVAKERQALLSFKKGLIDDYNLLSSWDSEDLDCCNWIGIRCSKRNGHIVSLDIGPTIKGEIGPSLLNLSHLNYLDLSHNDFTQIPEFLGSLNGLRYLNISQNYYLTVVPQHLGNLSALKFLDLSENWDLEFETLEWVSHLSSLEYLNMNSVDLSTTRDCFQSITKLPLLRKLYLEDSFVSIPWSLKDFNSSRFLHEVHISGGNLSSPAFYYWLDASYSELIDLRLQYAGLQGPLPDFLRNMISLEHLDLSENDLRGPIPNFIGDMSSLEHIDLSGNNLQGEIPKSFKNLCKLRTLDLSGNKLAGSRDFFESMTGCTENYHLQELRITHNQLMDSLPDLSNLPSLEVLDISSNNFNGSLKESIFWNLSNLTHLDISSNNFDGSLKESIFWNLSNLTYLDISSNNFDGSLKESIFWNLSNLTHLDISSNNFDGSLKESIFWNLSNLIYLDISSASLEGVIAEDHFSKLSELKFLSLRNNSFTLKFRDGWVPPFQLNFLHLGDCNLSDPHFPNWLRTQGSLSFLDISNTGISDTVPTWFRNVFSELEILNLSCNSISGPAPDCTFCWVYDLSNNQFHGPLPRVSFRIVILNLSGNKFSGSVSLLCTQELKLYTLLDLSHNLFSDNLTDCWMNSSRLQMLNLGNNNFTGKLPSSLKKCTRLVYLGLEQNQLYGEIPTWIGASLSNLMFLRLESNKFRGIIPSNICHLQSIKILDISMNSISGTIPSCLNNFTGLTAEGRQTESYNGFSIGTSDFDYSVQVVNWVPLWLRWKGEMLEFPIQTVGLLNYIDLSSNKLSGEIPEGLTSLYGLGSLNLSRNNLTGIIPKSIGHLRQLDSLDLSNNHLSGRIPESINNLSFIGKLDLSYNNLSGPIPTGNHLQTFDESAFIGNPQLCGLPLKVECSVHGSLGEGTTGSHSSQVDNEQWYENTGIWVNIVLGFLVGFHGVCGPLLYSASWRTAYYQFLNKIKDGLWVFVVLNIARLKRQFQQRM